MNFLNDLIASIEKTNDTNTVKPSPFYKPSSMNCIRNMYYQMIEEEVEVGRSDYKGIGIAETGTDRHARVQDAIATMRQNGFDCDYIDVAEFIKENNLTDLEVIGRSGAETKIFNKKLNMRFMTDGIIKYKGEYFIIEIKTEGSAKFKKRTSVDENHYNQATAYSISFGLDNVLFLYINRDSLEMKAIMLEVTEEMKQNVINKIKSCDTHLHNGTLPPKEENSYTCKFCKYFTKCQMSDVKGGEEVDEEETIIYF